MRVYTITELNTDNEPAAVTWQEAFSTRAEAVDCIATWLGEAPNQYRNPVWGDYEGNEQVTFETGYLMVTGIELM